jgi:hypothetical protein
VDELGVGHLLAGGDLDLDDGAEEAGEGGAEVPGEALVEGLEGAHLVLGDALGAFEVVGADFEVVVAFAAGEDAGIGAFLFLDASRRHRRRRGGREREE